MKLCNVSQGWCYCCHSFVTQDELKMMKHLASAHHVGVVGKDEREVTPNGVANEQVSVLD